MKTRGQAVVTDLFISISIFIILVTIIILTIELYDIRLQSKFDYEDMVLKTFLAIDTLAKSKGNKSHAALMLGISRKSLYKKLVDYNIQE